MTPVKSQPPFVTLAPTTSTNAISTPSISALQAFILATNNNPSKMFKRQTNIFVTSNGTNGVCSTGGSFILLGDQLYEDGMIIATNTSTGYVPLLPTGNGTISGGFSLGGSDTLTWSNSNFMNGRASFCLATDGLIYVIFSGSGPADCETVILSTLPGASCPGFQPVYPAGIVGKCFHFHDCSCSLTNE